MASLFGVVALMLCVLVRAGGQEVSVWTVDRFIAEAPKVGDALVAVHGTVIANWGNNKFFLEDQTAAILVYYKASTVAPRVGELVEVIGTPLLGGMTPHITATDVRSLGLGRLPVPRGVAVAQARNGQFDAYLVRIRGRLTKGVTDQPETRRIAIEEDGTTFTVEDLGTEGGSQWPSMEIGQLAEVTGVLSIQRASFGGPTPFRVFVRSRQDVRVVGAQPWWMPPRLYHVLAACMVVVAGSLAWAGLLRRQVREQIVEIRGHYEREAAAERKYRELVQTATDIVLTHDLEGRVTSFNAAGERLLGWSPAEILGRNIRDILPMRERGTAGGMIAEGVGRKDRDRAEVFLMDLLTKDGRALPFEISSSMETRDGKVVGVQSICRDLTERMRADEERARLERKLQETQKLESLGVLAGGIAHDFNNLLTGILGNASLALIETSPETPVGRSLQQIEVSAERAAELCRQMLAYSGHGRFVIGRIDVGEIIRGIAELLCAALHPNVSLELQTGDDTPCVVADATQIRQIVMNLVINANEAIGDRPGTITVTTGRMKADRAYFGEGYVFTDALDGDFVYIDVRDSGCGMSRETVGRIFDPFFTTKFTGRGLGLAAVLGIVRGHRGALKVSTAPGEGSAFRFLLPSAGPMQKVVDFAFPADPARSALALVLVVDDDETVRRVTQSLVESMGYEVIAASDGIEGLALFREHRARIHGVILDLTMPRMDGAVLFREMQRIQPDVRVLLMSGFAEQQALARFAGEGLAGFIRKPFAREALRTKLDAVLQGAGAPPGNVIPMRA